MRASESEREKSCVRECVSVRVQASLPPSLPPFLPLFSSRAAALPCSVLLQAKCLELPDCTAIVWEGQDHSGYGTCFRKKDVVPAKCDKGTGFDTYLHAGY